MSKMLLKSEIKKCKYDKVYFINKYITPLYKSQELILQNNNNKIIEHCRQSGFTTTIALDSLHNLLFNGGKNCVIFCDTVVECKRLSKSIFDLYSKLPNYIKEMFPIMDRRYNEIQFANNSKIYFNLYKSIEMYGMYSVHFLAFDNIHSFKDFENGFNSMMNTITMDCKIYIGLNTVELGNTRSFNFLKNFDRLYMDNTGLYKTVSASKNVISNSIKKCNMIYN